LAPQRVAVQSNPRHGQFSEIVMDSVLIEVTIEGTTPLLCNRFTDAAAMAASSGTRMAAVGEKGTPREQAEKRLYIGHDGKPIIPQPNLFRCLIDGGRSSRPASPR
jgi:hypothetical protein